MDVRLSNEQEALRDSVAQVVDRMGPHAVGQIGDAERGRKLDAAVNDSGWRELRTGTDDGSPLASGVESAIVAEELGRGLADTSFIGPTLATELRRLAGVPSGGSTETVAFDERLIAIAVVGERTGPPAVAFDSHGSSQALVLVRDGDRFRLAQVDLASPFSGSDLTRPAQVIGVDALVTMVEGTDPIISADDLNRVTALGLSLACADLVGTMRGAVLLSCDYATQRRQYGSAIGSFQAVQHMLADAHTVMEGSRSMARYAAWAADGLPTAEALSAASRAKAYCARAARNVCETAIQVHGGMGNTWECLAHVFLRRALLSIDLFGDDRVSLTRVLELEGIGGSNGLR